MSEANGQPSLVADVAYVMKPYVKRITGLETGVADLGAVVDELGAVVGEQGEKLKAASKNAGLAVKVYQDLQQVAATVEELGESVKTLTEATEKTKPWNVNAMDAEQLAATIRILADWLDDIGVRYGLLEPPASVRQQTDKLAERGEGGYIRPCWFRHWDVLGELAWLYQAWKAAYSGKTSSVRAVADWHDRYLNQTLYRMNKYGTIRNCRGGHEDPWDLKRGIGSGRVDRTEMEGFLDVMTGRAAAPTGQP